MRTTNTWWEYARCNGMDTRIFFEGIRTRKGLVEARQICNHCPVRLECLKEGMENDKVNTGPNAKTYGLWGGYTPQERSWFAKEIRKRIKLEQQRQRRSKCANPSYSAYKHGCKCGGCKDANNERSRQLRKAGSKDVH